MEVLRYNATSSRLSFVRQESPLSSSANASPRKENARRRLNFGGPAAPQTCAQQANNEFVQQMIAQMTQEYNQKWEFDFEAGQPLPSSSHSRFHYKEVETNAMPSVYSPVIHSSPVSIDEENVSDSENCCMRASLMNNSNRLADLANNSLKSKSEPLSADESMEFVLPCQSPKKLLKKPSASAYSTPKKSRVTQLTGELSLSKLNVVLK